MHNRLPFSTVRISHGLSTTFEGSVYRPGDQRRLRTEFEASKEKACPEISDPSEAISYDDGDKSVEVCLVLAVRRNQINFGCPMVMRMVQLASIPDSVV